MPKIASIVAHNNAFAPTVDSDTIRGGFLSVRATASGLAGEFDTTAALQSDGNKQDLVKEKGTVVYVTNLSDYYILNDKSASDIAPGAAGSGWITLRSAIGAGDSSLTLGTTAGTALEGDTTTITAAQASAIATNSSKVSFPGFGTSAGTALEGDTALLQLGTTSTTALAGDTTTISAAQASAISTNSSKVSFPGFGTSAGTALEGDTALLQLGTTSTTALAGDTTTISAAQASAISTNSSKVSFPGFGTSAGTALEGDTALLQLGTTSTTALAGDTTTISAAQASAISTNSSKVSFPGFGTSAGTALEGDTALLQLGTTSTTALAGDTTTISAAQASAISTNSSKVSFPGFGTSAGTALEGDTALLQLGTTSTTALAGDTTTISAAQASAIATNSSKVSFPGFGTSAGTCLEGDTDLSGFLTSSDLSGYAQLSGATFTGAISGTSLTLSGNLTVQGTTTTVESTTVRYTDSVLSLNIPEGLLDGSIENTAAPSSGTAGIEVFNGAAGGALSSMAQFVYDYNTDKWKASQQAAATTFDNVAALKFDVTDSVSQTDQADAGTTMPVDEFANASSVRSVGSVAKCTIEITDAATDGDSGTGTPNTNFAPDLMAANGYVIQHNLGTQSVFVVAIKTHNSSGGALADPQPVFCKYIPEGDNVIRVTVGITASNEKYDIIVIG